MHQCQSRFIISTFLLPLTSVSMNEAGRIVPEVVEMLSRRPQRTIEEIREEELRRWRTSESTGDRFESDEEVEEFEDIYRYRRAFKA